MPRSNARADEPAPAHCGALLAEATDEPPFTRSELERIFLELVRRANLPLPVVNGLVLTHEVDFHWPQHRLIVEADSRAFHAHALAFHQDRQRDLDLELAGWHVLRVTWRQVLDEPDRVTTLAEIPARRRDYTRAGVSSNPGMSERPRRSLPSPVVTKTSRMSSPPKQRLETNGAGTSSVRSSEPSGVKRTTLRRLPGRHPYPTLLVHRQAVRRSRRHLGEHAR